ncbi:hypothetical protein B0H13DRAFT_2417913 [Mycena leptocephala]|nr:hypothetical protein B0H13DRAFT_2417913 [Mycena leptocephala]
MEPSNSDEPGPSNQDKNSKKPKGKHGGARKNAGRPRKTLKAQLLGGIGTTTIPPLQQRAITYTSQAPSASSSRLPIAPFFLPYTTHCPVPLGNQTIMPAGRSSLWSALESPPTVETTISSSVSSRPKSKTKTRRCALCAKAECNKRSTCPGSGKQSLCMCGHPPLNGKKVRVSEATLIARLQRESLGQS